MLRAIKKGSVKDLTADRLKEHVKDDELSEIFAELFRKGLKDKSGSKILKALAGIPFLHLFAPSQFYHITQVNNRTRFTTLVSVQAVSEWI